MKPVHNFTDHRSLKWSKQSTIYVYDNKFYWANPDFLAAIELTGIGYTNLGEPFRELARLRFTISPTMKNGSIDISFEDAIDVINYCKNTGYPIELAKDLLNSREFQRYLDDDEDD